MSDVLSEDLWETFKKDSLTKSVNNSILSLLAELFVENVNLEKLKIIFNYDKENNSKRVLINNPNLYKWGCMYGDVALMKFLDKEMEFKDYIGAVMASITHNNEKTFKYLKRRPELYSEKMFLMAVSHNYRHYEVTNILKFYEDNLESLYDLSKYSVEHLKGVAKSANEDERVFSSNYTKKLIIKIESLLLTKKLEKEIPSKAYKKQKVKI